MHREVIMLYAYQLRAHSNARYQESLLSLSQKELACMLAACGDETEKRVSVRRIFRMIHDLR